jgi:hypothetical protein
MTSPMEQPDEKSKDQAKDDSVHSALLNDSIGKQLGQKDSLSLAAVTAKDDMTKNAALLVPDAKMTFGEKALRVGQVSAEGVVYTIPGALHAVQHDLDPANWKETATKIATAGAMGVIMRVALPESGAFKAIVGTAMGVYFMKDAAKPVVQAWYDVATQPGDAVMTRAAKNMGDGLGAFVVDGYIAGKVAGFTGRMTPVLAEKFVPTQWAALENWKEAKFGATSNIGMEMGSALEYVDNKFQKLGDKLNPPKPDIKSLSREQIMASIADSRQRGVRADYSEKIYTQGMTGSDGNAHGLDGTVELLLQGKDPRKVPAGSQSEAAPAAEPRTAYTQVDGWKQTKSGLFVPDYIDEAGKGKGTINLDVETADAKGRGRASSRSRGGDRSVRVEEGLVEPTGNPAEQVLNADTMGKMAGVIKAQLKGVDDTASLVRDGINRTTSAVHAATDPDFKPMDKGYQMARNAMIDLANQVGDDPKNFMEVDPLFQRLSDASIQAHAQDLGPNGKHVARMNTYTAENQTTYVRNMIKAGIDPEKALAQKPLPPLVELSDDQSPIGRDPKTGEVITAHEGPHTVRAIYGPNGEPVWPIDLIKYPMREVGTRSYLTSAIYGHEEFHDQYGQMGKLDPQIRDARLMSAVEKALGADGEKMVSLPKATPQELAAAKAAARKAARAAAKAGVEVEAPEPTAAKADAMPPLPEQMALKEVMVNVAKAWADETFADWGATAESGQSAAPYFQALRKGGKLYNGTVMSEEMRSPENPLGVEVHPVDKLRPRFQAALIRKLASAGGETDQLLLNWADALDKYSRDASVKGDGKIIFASEDHVGQKMAIPEAVFDKIIPELVNVQLETPLPKLQGKTLFDILPDLRKNMHRNEALSDLWVDAIAKGKEPKSISFDKSTLKITNVYGAGQPALLKLIAGGMDPMEAAESVNKFSDYFGNKFLSGDPHVDPIKVPVGVQLQLAPAATLVRMPKMISHGIGNTIAHQYEARNWIGDNAIPIAGASGSVMMQDLLNMSKKTQELLKGN